MIKSVRFFAIALAVMLQPWFMLAPAQAQLKPAWNCLPGETVFAVRIPDGKAVYDTIRQGTKLGKVIFSDERQDALKKMLQEGDPEAWEKFSAEIGKFDLSIDDFPAVYAGETGIALVVEKIDGRDTPMLVMLAWANPGEELAVRLLKAMDTILQDRKDEAGAPERVDFEIDGQPVTHLAMAEQGLPPLPDFPPDFENMTPEQIQEFFEQRRIAREKAKPEKIDQSNMLITRMGGRVMLAMTFPQNKDVVQKAKDTGGDIDFNRLTGLETTTGVFARFLAAHKGTDGPFVSKAMATPGLRDAMPKGMPLVEMLGNVRPLLDMMAAEEPDAGRVLKALGLDKIGAFALSMNLDGPLMRSALFVEAPGPRQGVLEAIDQKTMPAEMPAWVSSNVVSYQHIALDLGVLYSKIKTIVLEEFGEEARAGFDMIEMQVKNFAQADLATVLSSVGTQHTQLVYPAQKVNLDGADPVAAEMSMQRQAWVWQLQNEQVWTNLFTQLAQFLTQPGGGMQKVEEQGFTGFRMAEGPMQGGLFMGKGYLVFGLGQGVVEETLSVLRNPPEGEAALRNTPGYAEARRLLPPKAGLSYQYMNMDKYAGSMFDIISSAMTAPLEAQRAENPNMALLLDKLIPKSEEMQGVFGVGGGQMFFNDHGLVSEGVLELPPAE